ncbi:MAG TPA: nodulation protein NfeD [Candidatus Saccharimonadales bacterium]|jgi:membrane-bound serine protease (ClpP class)|nr:nodulation protein NfeD [Candidatus Saccharimonadales bacterium]
MNPTRPLFARLASVAWMSEHQLRRKIVASYGFRPLTRHLVLFALSSFTLLFFFPSVSADQQPSAPVVLDLNLHGVVEPILATYIDEGIADAEHRQAALILITMDTPGGLSDSMQDIIKHILASRVPVAVYVTPTGARGASAGFFILLSADIAAMAPGTHTGAASPVIAIAGWQLQVDETMKRKILNDALAFLRSYAEKRGRNPALAETAVTDAKAFTDKEALDGKLIDLVAPTTDDLLRQLDGRQITRFDGSKTKLSLANAKLTPFELSARQKFLSRIVEPDIFFVLLIIGVLGLYTEFTHPGVIAPGVVGGICAVLALYAMQILPVNIAGVLLILLALALFILEAKYTSHGVLAAGGIISMLLGAMFLIRSPLTAGGVSLGVALSVTLPFAVLTVLLMRLVLRSRSWKNQTGREEMINAQGIVVTPLGDGAEGMIRVHGELWRAISDQPVPEGKPVRVLKMEGLKLYVEPVA